MRIESSRVQAKMFHIHLDNKKTTVCTSVDFKSLWEQTKRLMTAWALEADKERPFPGAGFYVPGLRCVNCLLEGTQTFPNMAASSINRWLPSFSRAENLPYPSAAAADRLNTRPDITVSV
jgi:hypothetical protein